MEAKIEREKGEGSFLSRRIIQDIIIPIVEKIMREQRILIVPSQIRDSKLEEFLEEEMRRHFGVIGANECQHLREQLEEARKNDPDALEFLLKLLLEKYMKLASKLRQANIVV
jgi:hypothetical protein